MKKKIICIALSVVVLSGILAACGKKKNEQGNATAENTNPTVIETVTDESGETVTDASGEAVTEVFEQVPVTDHSGEQVTSANGEKVTEKILATTSPKSENTTKPSSNGSSTQPTTTTKLENPTNPSSNSRLNKLSISSGFDQL